MLVRAAGSFIGFLRLKPPSFADSSKVFPCQSWTRYSDEAVHYHYHRHTRGHPATWALRLSPAGTSCRFLRPTTPQWEFPYGLCETDADPRQHFMTEDSLTSWSVHGSGCSESQRRKQRHSHQKDAVCPVSEPQAAHALFRIKGGRGVKVETTQRSVPARSTGGKLCPYPLMGLTECKQGSRSLLLDCSDAHHRPHPRASRRSVAKLEIQPRRHAGRHAIEQNGSFARAMLY